MYAVYLRYWYKSTNTDVKWADKVYSVYSLYWYKGTNTDADVLRRLRRMGCLRKSWRSAWQQIRKRSIWRPQTLASSYACEAAGLSTPKGSMTRCPSSKASTLFWYLHLRYSSTNTCGTSALLAADMLYLMLLEILYYYNLRYSSTYT